MSYLSINIGMASSYVKHESYPRRGILYLTVLAIKQRRGFVLLRTRIVILEGA